MTKCYVEQDGSRFLIYCDGHAGDVEACNFMTGIVYALAGYVHNAQTEDHAEIFAYETDKARGRFLLHFTGDERTEAAFETAVIGLQMLERERPACIHIDYGEENT